VPQRKKTIKSSTTKISPTSNLCVGECVNKKKKKKMKKMKKVKMKRRKSNRAS